MTLNDLETQASQIEAKAKAWFGSNWYPFAIGAGCMAGLWLLTKIL